MKRHFNAISLFLFMPVACAALITCRIATHECEGPNTQSVICGVITYPDTAVPFDSLIYNIDISAIGWRDTYGDFFLNDTFFEHANIAILSGGPLFEGEGHEEWETWDTLTYRRIFPFLDSGHTLAICTDHCHIWWPLYATAFLKYIGSMTIIEPDTFPPTSSISDSVYHIVCDTPVGDIYAKPIWHIFDEGEYSGMYFHDEDNNSIRVDSIMSNASMFILPCLFPVLPIVLPSPHSVISSAFPPAPLAIIGLTWFCNGRIILIPDMNILPDFGKGVEYFLPACSCRTVHPGYDCQQSCYHTLTGRKPGNKRFLKNLMDNWDATLLPYPDYDFVFRGAPFVVNVDLGDFDINRDAFYYDRKPFTEAPILQCAILHNWLAWERRACEYFADDPVFCALPESLYIRFALNCTTAEFHAAPVWAYKWPDTLFHDIGELLSALAYDGLPTPSNWWKPLGDGDRLDQSWTRIYPVQNLIGRAMAKEYAKLVAIGGLGDTLPRLRDYVCPDSTIIMDEYWGFGYLPQWINNRTNDTIRIVRTRLHKAAAYDTVATDCGDIYRMQTPDWQYNRFGNIAWAAYPDTFGLFIINTYECINDFSAPSCWLGITAWHSDEGYGTANLLTDTGYVTIYAETETTYYGFADLHTTDFYLDGAPSHVVDVGYVLLGGSGEILSYDCSPSAPGIYICPEPLDASFAPGTTYMDWNQYISTVPEIFTIEDGVGELFIYSIGVDTIHVSFALPRGYSAMPNGAAIPPVDSISFSIYADVVRLDGADTIWLFTDEPAVYPIVVYGEGRVSGKTKIPQKLSLSIIPNPFNSSVYIKYSIDRETTIEISIYDVLGQRASTLLHEPKIAGNYSVEWNAENDPSGIYFVRLKAGEQAITKRAILIR